VVGGVEVDGVLVGVVVGVVVGGVVVVVPPVQAMPLRENELGFALVPE
jgi:hypothetical protein